MSSLYSSMPQSSMAWPEPMETIYQMLGAEPALPARFKRRELGLSARMYIAAVGNLPPDTRPWGSMTSVGPPCIRLPPRRASNGLSR